MRLRQVVTCFLQHGGNVLLLKRSQAVATYRGRWAGVSGSIEAATPLDQAFREVREETGLGPDALELLRQGPPLDVPDPATRVTWRVHPFLFAVREPSAIRLDWEHTESRWMPPAAMGRLDTVPMLKETWERVSAT